MDRLSTSQPAPIPNEVQRRSEMLVRTLPISLLPVFAGLLSGLLIRFLMGGSPGSATTGPHRSGELLVGLAVAVILFTALIMLARLGRPTISVVMFISIWTLVTTLAAIENGVTTFWPALLIMPICAAGLLLDGVASATLALLDTLLIAVSAGIQRQELAGGAVQGTLFIAVNRPIFAAGFWIAVFWSVAALTWLLAGSLQRALAQSRAQAIALRELSLGLEARVAAQTAELAKRADRAEALYEVSRALTDKLDLSEVLALIAELAARLLRFESALVLLANSEDGSFMPMSAYQPPARLHESLAPAAPLLRAALEQRHAHVVPLALSDGAPTSTLVLPMRYGASVSGVLILMDNGSTAARGEDDLALAEGLADQAALAIANAQLVARLRESATLEERTRLARDIHDTLAQGLTGIVIQLSAADQSLVDAPEEVAGHLDLAQRMAREALAEARRSVWNLRAPALERGDLGDALRTLATRPLRPDTQISFEQHGEPWSMPAQLESSLLRVGQEALANIAKHANASQASVTLEYTAEAVALAISDNGIGFDADAALCSPVAPGSWGGLGLLGMRERLAALGGELTITTHGGTHVRAVVPRARAIGPDTLLSGCAAHALAQH